MTKRTYLENDVCIDVIVFRRKGWLVPGAEFKFYLALLPRLSLLEHLKEGLEGNMVRGYCEGESIEFSYPYHLGKESIGLEQTACNYGGKRFWFACPQCGKRAGKLYYRAKGMRCRNCAGLSYQCQSEASYDRAMRRAKKAYRQTATLGWQMEHRWINEFPPKPKGMHDETYARLFEQFVEGFCTWHDHARSRVERMGRRFMKK